MLLADQAWERLEKAEHERGVALRKELIRQEKLELLAQRFDHKTTMRQAWLNENQRLVSQVQFLLDFISFFFFYFTFHGYIVNYCG